MNGSVPARRGNSTREKLMRSFVELVLSRGYAHLTPGDVAARAGVGRSTLYTHFAGLPRILEASLDRQCATLAASILSGASPGELVPLLRHFHSQRHHNAVFFRDPIRSLWSGRLARAITVKLRRTTNSHPRHSSIPREMLAPVLAELQLAIIVRWLTEAPSLSAEAVALALTASAQRIISH
jgi:AcrR family transcriptional regulator